MNNQPPVIQDLLFEQMKTISKAHAYDIISEQVKELKEENENLKNDLDAWKKIALGYRELLLEHEKNIKSLLNK